MFLPPHRKHRPGGKTAPGRRTLRFEPLENREMLSVSPLQLPQPEYLAANWFEQLVVDDPAESTESAESGLVENEWLIQMSREILEIVPSVSAAADYLLPYGVTVLGGLGTEGALYVRMETGAPEMQSEILAGIDGLDYWEQNVAIASAAVKDVVNDPMASLQWALDAANVLPAWNVTKGSGVVVAVLDSGIQLSHPDLQANIWTNTGEIPGNGRDDDGNGFIDDVNGWNADANTNNVNDINSHGTHVSGIIGAVDNNGVGVTGVAPDVKIMPLKVGNGPFSGNAIITAINYVTMMKTRGVNVKVINASFGSLGDGSFYRSAVAAAGAAGIMFVAATGNDAKHVDVTSFSPACLNDMDNVISVASIASNYYLSSFSNYGTEKVDLAAPGSSILSTTIGSQYMNKSGTSMAAPMVSGAVALVAAANPTWTPAQIKAAILNSVTTLSTLSGKTKTGGMLDIGAALTTIPGIPATPSQFSAAVQDNGTIKLQWKDNSNNELYFEIQQSTDGGVTWTVLHDKIATASTTYSFRPGTVENHLFRIRAKNGYGSSAWSATATVTQAALQLPPKAPKMTATYAKSEFTGIVTHSLNWADSDRYNAETFEVQQSLDQGRTWTEITIRQDRLYLYGLVMPDGETWYRARGTNQYGTSAWSEIWVLDQTKVPAAPTNLTVSKISGPTLKFQWQHADPDSATSMRVEESPDGGETWVLSVAGGPNQTGQGITYTPKEPGNYLFRLRFWNYNGFSEASNVISYEWTEPAQLPAPSDLAVVSQTNGTVRLEWRDNSLTENEFHLYYSKNGGETWIYNTHVAANVTTMSFTMEPGVDYLFHVRAYERGRIIYSAYSNVVSARWDGVYEPPLPPSHFTVDVAEDGTFRFQWRDNSTDETMFELQYSADDGASWSTATTPAANTTSADLNLSQDVDYLFRLRARHATASSTWTETITAIWSSLPRPKAPTGLTVGSQVDGTFLVSWTDNADIETGFELEHSIDGGLNWTATQTLGPDETAAVVTAEAGLIYRFRVRALGENTPSPWSNIVTTKWTDPYDIAAPGGFTATFGSDSSVICRWTAVDAATTYKIERNWNTYSEDEWITVYVGPGTALGSKTLEFRDDELRSNRLYYYRISSVNDYTASDPGAVISVRTSWIVTPPPTGLTLAHVDATTAQIIWDDVARADSYLIQRAEGSSHWWTTVGETTVATFTDSGLKASSSYRYRIFATAGRMSDPSGDISVTTLVPPPSAPTSVTVKAQSTTAAGLTWKVPKGATSYRVEYSGTGADGSWQTVPLSHATETGGTVDSLTAGMKYYFRVYAVSASGESKVSSTVSLTLPTVAPEHPPETVVAEAQSDKIVALNWSAVENATGYVIERSTDAATWKKVATTKNGVTEYLDKSLAAGTVYHYRISATGSTATTISGETATVQTKLAEAAASTIKIDTKKIGVDGAAGLTIVASKTAFPAGTAYCYIQYASAVDAKKNPDWNAAVTEKADGPTFDISSGLTPNTQYYIRMVAVDREVSLDAAVDWNSFDNLAYGKAAKFKTKAVPLAKIATSGYAMSSDGRFGVKIRITTPAQNDNAKNPVLSTGTTFSYQLIVAGDKAKVDKTTGLLVDGEDLGPITLAETTIKSKTYFDSSLIRFSDLARIGDLTTMKSVQIQLLVTYTVPDGTAIATIATKVVKLALPKWFA